MSDKKKPAIPMMKPPSIPDVEAPEVTEVTAAMSAMNNSPENGGGIYKKKDKEGESANRTR